MNYTEARRHKIANGQSFPIWGRLQTPQGTFFLAPEFPDQAAATAVGCGEKEGGRGRPPSRSRQARAGLSFERFVLPPGAASLAAGNVEPRKHLLIVDAQHTRPSHRHLILALPLAPTTHPRPSSYFYEGAVYVYSVRSGEEGIWCKGPWAARAGAAAPCPLADAPLTAVYMRAQSPSSIPTQRPVPSRIDPHHRL
jgi:hypothetical protein